MLELECRLFDPISAYQAGALHAAENKTDYIAGLQAYLTEYAAIVLRMESFADAVYRPVYQLLKRKGKEGLLDVYKRQLLWSG